MRASLDVEDLVSTMEENKTMHLARYEAAYEAYRRKALEQLQETLLKVRDNEPFNLHFALPVPENHVRHYDRAIAMLKKHTESKIVLSSEDYSRYVDDEWDWKSRFQAVTSTYVAD